MIALESEEDGGPKLKRSKPTPEEIEFDRRIRDRISQFTTDEQQEELYDKDTFVRPYLKPPCCICASDDHGVLQKISVIGDDLGEEYNCPYAFHTDWHAMRLETAWGERFRICPIKIAEKSGHDIEVAMKVIDLYSTEGEGRNHLGNGYDP